MKHKRETCGHPDPLNRVGVFRENPYHPLWQTAVFQNFIARGLNLSDTPAVDCTTKILSQNRLSTWREEVRRSGRKLVITNGCFDLLHAGHVTYLQKARNLGDLLLIGLNGDASVRALKGEGRPLNTEADRALVLAALECVNAVCIFPEVRATRFLEMAQPDIYVKGGDYTPDTLDQDERRAVESHGGRIEIIPFLPGRSTTNIIRRMGGSPAV